MSSILKSFYEVVKQSTSSAFSEVG